MHPLNCLRVFLALLLLASFLPGQEETERLAEERLLKEHRVGLDGPGLLRFLRLRSPSAEDKTEVLKRVEALGSDSFEEREQASLDLIQRGASVLEDLKKRSGHNDAEVRRRLAQAILDIEHGPGGSLSIAVVRRLAQVAPPGSVAAILRFAPFAEDDNVEDELVLALEKLCKERLLETALLQGLRDPASAVRGLAGRVVGKLGSTEQKTQAGELLKDASAGVRFRVAQGLLAGGQREAVLTLIGLLIEDSPLAWQAEEVLFRLAGDKGPTETASLLGAEGRQKSRGIWETWWRDHGKEIDLARLNSTRQLGLTLGVEYNTGRVWEAGPDRTMRFDITGLQGPMEAQLLSGGRVLIAESNARKITERDLRGNVLWTLDLKGQEPTGCQRLTNGNTFVSSYSSVAEFDRDGKQIYDFRLPSGSNAIRKHRNGNIIFATEKEIIELNVTGAEVRRIAIPSESMWVGLRDLPGDRFLLANSNSGKVLEIDATGKKLWEARVPGACGVDRAINGHTLVATSGRVVELDRTGKEIWELKTTGYVRRVHRR